MTLRLTILLITCQMAFARDFFVATNGLDSNAGTNWATARLTIGSGYSLLNAASNDTLYIGPGRFPERLTVLKTNVTLTASNVAVRAASAPSYVTNTLVAASDSTTSSKGFDVQANTVTIRGFEITQITNGNVVGINVYANTTNVTLELNYIHNLEVAAGSEPYGVHLRDVSVSGCTVRSNLLYQVEGFGIGVVGNAAWIEANEVSHGRNMNSLGVKVQSDCDASRCLGTENVWTNNFFHDYLMEEQFFELPISSMPHIDGCMLFTQGSGVLISNTTFVANVFKNFGDQGLICRDIYTNYALMANLRAFNNIFWNCGSGSYTWNIHDVPNCKFMNNLVLANVGPYFWSSNANLGTNYYTSFPYRWDREQQNGGQGLLLENNIFYGFGSNFSGTVDTWSLTNTLVDYNLWFPTPAGTPMAAPNDTHTLTNSDPKFALLGSDFHLLAGSPAINTGTNLSSYFTTDRAGNTRAVPWDIGAYEFIGSTLLNHTITGQWSAKGNWTK